MVQTNPAIAGVEAAGADESLLLEPAAPGFVQGMPGRALVLFFGVSDIFSRLCGDIGTSFEKKQK